MIIKKDLSRQTKISDGSDNDISFEQRRAERKRRRISYHFKGSVNTPTHSSLDEDDVSESQNNRKSFNSTGASRSKLTRRKISLESLRRSKINLDEKLKSVQFNKMENIRTAAKESSDLQNGSFKDAASSNINWNNQNIIEGEDDDIQVVEHKQNQLYNNENFHHNDAADDDSPHTPMEKEIPRPLVSPGFSLKRRSLIGEVIGSPRRIQRNTPNRLKPSRDLSNTISSATVDAVESAITDKENTHSSSNANNRENIKASHSNVHIKQDKDSLKDGTDDDEDDFRFIETKSKELLAIEGKEIRRAEDFDEHQEDVFYHTENKEEVTELSNPENLISSPPEQLSRISIQENNTNASATGVFDEETEENVENSNEKNILETPTRVTKAVAVSPLTEQKSRLLDDTDLLDTSQPVPVVNVESPLANHKPHLPSKKTSPIIQHLLEGMTYSPSRTKKSPKVGLSPASIKKKQKLNRRRTMAVNFGNNETSSHDDDMFSQNIKEMQRSILEELVILSSEVGQLRDRSVDGQNYLAKIQEQYNHILKSLNLALDSKESELANLTESLSLSNMKLRETQQRLDETLSADRQLLEKNEILTVEVKSLYENIDILTGDIALKDEKLNKYLMVAKKIEKIYDSQNNEIKALHTKIKSLSENIAELLQEKSELQETISLSENKLRSTISELLDSKKLQDSFIVQVDELKRNIDMEIANVVDLKTEIEKLNIEKENLKSNLEQTKVKYEDEIDLRKNLEREIEKYIKDEETLQTLNSSSSLEIEELRLKCDTLEKLNKKLQVENNDLIKDIGTNNVRLQDFEKELNELNSKYIESLKATDLKLGDINELNSKVGELNDRIKELEEINTTMSIDLNKERQVVAELEDKVMESQEIVSSLNDKLQKQAAADDVKNKKISGLESQIEAQRKELEASRNENAEKAHNLNEELTVKEQKLAIKIKELEQLADKTKELETQIDRLKEHVAKSNHEIEQFKKDKIELEAQTEDRLTRLSEDLYLQYSRKHEQKIGILKKGYEAKWQSKINHINSANDSLRKEIEGLKEQLANEKKEKAQFMKLWEKVVKMDLNK